LATARTAFLAFLETIEMYDALTNFLRTFSADNPLPWALLVMVVIGGSALGLYALWEVVLKAGSAAFGRSRSDSHP
jgi:hypothetical protein